MLILLNYGVKLLKRRWYTYIFHVNPLTHGDAPVVDNVLLNSLPFPI